MSNLQTAIHHPLRSFGAAMSFLTVFPGFTKGGQEQDNFGAALYYFTLAGFLLGCCAAFCGLVLQNVASPLVTSVALAIILSSLSGFLHLDGLADTADGFLSARDRERSLEIMKDSRIGVMGAALLLSVLLLKSAALFSIGPQKLTGALICSAAAGRTAMVIVIYFLPYARAEGGLGQLFILDECGYMAPLISSLLLLFIIAVLLPAKMVVIICVFLLLLIVFSLWCIRKIGGFTGDTLGCLCEVMETGILLGVGLNF
ncbi:MAG: adenosylcobinamide-GDP ribazoletransferase [Desulfofustis sp.]|nr:adenosylcobinamide-GDP ribazoletransferase [Desulfofustis sp.]NNK56840.1 adenosylcobinamide-GDP ribazoletransferase [Desulfofustis sp.]